MFTTLGRREKTKKQNENYTCNCNKPSTDRTAAGGPAVTVWWLSEAGGSGADGCCFDAAMPLPAGANVSASQFIEVKVCWVGGGSSFRWDSLLNKPKQRVTHVSLAPGVIPGPSSDVRAVALMPGGPYQLLLVYPLDIRQLLVNQNQSTLLRRPHVWQDVKKHVVIKPSDTSVAKNNTVDQDAVEHKCSADGECGDGVAGIKRRHRDPSSDGVRDLVTASGRGRLNEDLESST
ncbi:hypothetical protein Tco_0122949 [Tanacetum coccineum]